MTQGIYEIANWQDGKASTYVGSSMNIEGRWEQHRSDLRAGRHSNAHLQRAWDKYSEEAFVFSVLEEVEVEMLLVMEQEYLDDYFDRGHCYNIAITAGPGGPVSEEIRRKISETLMGHEVSEETRQKLSETFMGHEVSKETRHKLSEANRDKVLSEEHKLKLAETNKGNQYTLGHKLTKEHKCKISEACKGKKPSEETRRKMSRASKGRMPSEEVRRKMSKAAMGNQNALGHKHTHTKTARCKISEANKRRWAKRKELNVSM